jgi:predicted alpha-1,2-mannosidase
MTVSQCGLLLLAGAALPLASTGAAGPASEANPLVGTAALDDPALIGNAPPPGKELFTGFVLPGPALPHGFVNLSPINKDVRSDLYPGLQCAYTWSRRTMMGFSSVVEDMTVMPLVGPWTVPPDRSTASVYDKGSERASPGYYRVSFPDYGVTTELTATERAGLYRIRFPAGKTGTLLVDLGPGEGRIEVVGDSAIRGAGADGRRRMPFGRDFIAEFSRPFSAFGTFRQKPPVLRGGQIRRSTAVTPGSRQESGSFAGCFLDFPPSGAPVLVKMAAGAEPEQARRRLNDECPGWDFEAVKTAAESAWNAKLGRIEIEGGSPKERTLFYSALYHALASPRRTVRAGERFTGLDGSEKTASHDRYTPVPFWDTGRNQVVLLMLLEPDVVSDALRTHLDMARETGWMDTAFHGDHAVLMYLGAWERGYQFDWAGAYTYLRRNATDPRGPRRYLAEYLQKGWIHDDVVPHPSPGSATPYYQGGNAGVAKTMEYAWDDSALALYAKRLGRQDDAAMFLRRARNYANVFDRSTGFVRGRTAGGAWISPFDPEEPYYNYMYKEANAWQTLWLVPQDVAGLIGLLGGRGAFCRKLDAFFATPYRAAGIERDDTGMIGQYCQGDQPDVQTAYYYDYAGQPWKTQAMVRRILRLMYGSGAAGLAYPGMDDQGSTSSWYVLSALGFYPVNPALPEYVIGSPLFPKAVLHLGNGRDLTIVARNNSDENVFVQSATLNGRPLDRPWFSHSQIANGATIVLTMGPRPNPSWGSAADAAPASLSP